MFFAQTRSKLVGTQLNAMSLELRLNVRAEPGVLVLLWRLRELGRGDFCFLGPWKGPILIAPGDPGEPGVYG